MKYKRGTYPSGLDIPSVEVTINAPLRYETGSEPGVWESMPSRGSSGAYLVTVSCCACVMPGMTKGMPGDSGSRPE